MFFGRLTKSLRPLVRLQSVGLLLPYQLVPGKNRVEDPFPNPSGDAFDVLSPASWFRTAKRASDADAVLLVQWMPLTMPGYLALIGALRLWGRVDGRRTRIHLLVHDVRPDRWWPMANTLLRVLLRAADGVTVLTREVECDVRRIAPRLAVHRAEHPVYDSYGEAVAQPEARMRLGLPVQDPVLLFFGHVKPYKGLDVLMEAFPAIQLATGSHLLVAGGVHPAGQAQADALERLRDRSAYVTFRQGLVPPGEISDVFCSASVCVLPYRRPAASGSLQIAAFYERPIVAPRFDAFGDVERLGVGVLFEPGDPNDLVRAVREALDLPSDQVATGFARWKTVYSWDRFSREWVNFALNGSSIALSGSGPVIS